MALVSPMYLFFDSRVIHGPMYVQFIRPIIITDKRYILNLTWALRVVCKTQALTDTKFMGYSDGICI
jgi:hypothetical protein